MPLKNVPGRIYNELGLQALVSSPADTKILVAQRFIRLFAYGSSTLVLALFLLELDYNAAQIGLFMSLTLWGDVAISLILTLFADKIGRRRILTLGALLMVVSGVAFATSSQFWILLLASIFGVISPSGNEIGPFRAVEESTISQLIDLADRSSVFAWYALSGTAGVALGTFVLGWVVDVLQVKYGWTAIESYRVVFWIYALLGIVKCTLCFVLSSKCELEAPKIITSNDINEEQPLLAQTTTSTPSTDQRTEGPSKWLQFRSWLPDLTSHTVFLLIKLCTLFVLDSLGSGIASASWLVYFFHNKFGLQEGQLGSLFFVTNILAAISSLAAASLSKRIGLVKTMVFTHLPASISLSLLPIPSNKAVAMALLIFRSSIANMDTAPRQAFLAAAVLPEERTTVMGIVNVLKTLSQSLGPIVTGSLAQGGKIGVAFIVAGAMKSGYDVLMLAMFLGYRTIEEKARAQVVDQSNSPANRDASPSRN